MNTFYRNFIYIIISLCFGIITFPCVGICYDSSHSKLASATPSEGGKINMSQLETTTPKTQQQQTENVHSVTKSQPLPTRATLPSDNADQPLRMSEKQWPSETQTPADPNSSLNRSRPQSYSLDELPSASKMNEGAYASSRNIPNESDSKQSSVFELVGLIARFLLKISLIIMCCLALFYSFSALQIVKSHHNIE